jgi:uncharacterized cupin superfamily protein
MASGSKVFRPADVSESNASNYPEPFRVIGDRTAGDEVTYPDIDLELKAGPDGVRGFRRKDGTPYPRAARD